MKTAGGAFLHSAFVLLLIAPATLRAEVDFQRDIRPILSNRCIKCHGPAVHKGGARLDSPEGIRKRKIVVPGNANASRLIRRVTAGDEERMPPVDTDERLSSAEVAKLREWINQGAPWAGHWAYVPPRASPLPAVKDPSWPGNTVDHFILARLEKAGLRPSPAADRVTLIRRVYLDLLGLLPQPGEVDAFLADTRPDAYERLVDRLLASPAYGERQARHWLDLARYADSNGYTIDGKRSIWPYRDWVINAFNRDLPFDQFTIEQLAGDLLPSPTQDQLIATGFQRNTPFNEEGGTDPEQFRVERTLDRTNTIGAVWLGLTVACAQCHDHKFDAISQKEYYQLYAFFNSAQEPVLDMPTPGQRRQLEGLNEQKKRAAKEPKQLRVVEKQIKDLRAVMPSTLIMRESAKPRASHVHLRGDFLTKGPSVEPGTLDSLPPLGVKGRQANRLDLARWLVRPDNPLTPRVVVNRMWQQLFGQGLVETENDFGMQGSVPTHPELLDWLAVAFVRQGWSLKGMHRLLVTSATYRQSSVVRPDLREKDPRNKLLGRQARMRVEAEIVRDAALSASGLLTTSVGGPGVFPPQPAEVFSFTQTRKAWVESKGPDRYRRGLYTFIWRQSQHPLLATFDGADAQTSCTRRNRSNTPLQALHLANNRAFVEIAEGLAERVLREGPADEAGRIDLAFRFCLGRPPEDDERQRLLQFLAVQKKEPKAAWAMVARVLLNLDEFITRE